MNVDGKSTGMRALSLCLCLVMLGGSMARAEEMMLPLPTPTPEPALVLPMAEVTEPPEESATEAPVSQDTPAPTQEPTVTPEGTPEPAQETLAPEESQSAPPAASETPLPDAQPVCGDESCIHVGLDDAGDPVALCALGQWLLTQPETQVNGGMRANAASKATPMKLRNGENVIYRSGTYRLTAGGDRAKLSVARGLAVSLKLDSIRLLTFSLLENCAASLAFEGANQIATIAAPKATLTVDGNGALWGVNNLNCRSLKVLGGCVHLPDYAVSQNGRAQYAFAAQGATSATVDGEPFAFTLPDPADGNAYLWLPQPSSAYSATVVNSVLCVTSAPAEPGTKLQYSLSSPDDFAPIADAAYDIVPGDAPASRTLTVDASGVSLFFTDIGGDAYQPSIEALRPVTLYLSGQNRMATLNSPQAVTLAGGGRLSLSALNAPQVTASGALTVCADQLASGSLAGWQRVPVNGDLSIDVTASHEGAKLALVYINGDRRTALLPLDPPATGMRYEGALTDKRLDVKAVPDGAVSVLLGSADVTLASGDYIVRSEAGATGDLLIAPDASCNVALEGARTTGALIVGANADLSVSLGGGSLLGGACRLESGATLALDGTGALTMGSLKGESGSQATVGGSVNVTLSTGSALPGSKLKPTVVYVTDDRDAPMADALITLRLGDQNPFETTTTPGGLVTLWRSKALGNVSVTALADGQTYTAVIKAGGASPDALPVITSASETKYSAVKLTTDVACQTMGVMYYVSSAAKPLPDTYTADALYASAGANGECTLRGVKNGDIITYRAYACVQKTTLSAATADAFAFGERRVFTAKGLRAAFTLDPQQKTYDKKSFTLPQDKLPKGATVEYYRASNQKKLSSAPVDVGEYEARVTVPEGDAKYLPGVYPVKLTIDKIVVLVYPDEASKLKDEDDPPFTYTYDDSVMFDGDDVTGTLTRKKGESYGNYPYYATNLKAASYYELRVDDYTPAFFIDWNAHHYLPYDPFAKIDPVYDELLLSSGRTLSAQRRTNEVLRVDGVLFGTPVTDTLDNKARPVTPGLRLRGGYDSALLILTAEPELNADGGYLTDADGNRVLRGRRLTLQNRTLNLLKEHHIDHIAFSLNGVSVLIALDDLRVGGALDKVLQDEKLSRLGTSYSIVLEPVNGAQELKPTEGAAADAAAFKRPLMRVSAELHNGSRTLDITSVLKNATVCFDASALLESASDDQPSDGTVETVNGKPVATAAEDTALAAAAIAAAQGTAEATGELLSLAADMLDRQIKAHGYGLYLLGDAASALDTSAVVPYTASESKTAMFSALMRTKPYLSAPFTQSGLYGMIPAEN